MKHNDVLTAGDGLYKVKEQDRAEGFVVAEGRGAGSGGNEHESCAGDSGFWVRLGVGILS